VTEGQRYGQVHGLRCNAPQSWTVPMLSAALSRGPLMFDMLWNSGEYAAGLGSPGHMIVVVGIRGDGDPSGRGTTVRIQDPWPPNKGKVYSRGYLRWVQELPTMTYRVLKGPDRASAAVAAGYFCAGRRSLPADAPRVSR
jgi:hypothetical protein